MEMTQEWITQFNKKCAEFVGEETTTYFIETQMDLIGSNALQFHSDWNWIMEVVEAIEKIENTTVVIWYGKEGCTIEQKRFEDGDYYSSIRVLVSKKQAVIQAIDQFIDWYNKQKESITNTFDETFKKFEV